MNHHKRGFTLTELLIVVIVIGILSAVVLPRYNKTLETRKTTEAEDILSAIRTEQERRCTLGKKYVTDMAKLSEIVPNTETNNYTYSLFSTNAGGQGLSWHTVSARAISRGSYEYGLYMFSNSDGRICCQGPDCTKLNKDYPLCEELVTHTDLQRSAFEEARECGFETAAPIPNPPTPPSWEEEYQVGDFTLEGKEPGGSGGGDGGDGGGLEQGLDDGGSMSQQECSPGAREDGAPCGCNNQYREKRICNSDGNWTIDTSACISFECTDNKQELASSAGNQWCVMTTCFDSVNQICNINHFYKVRVCNKTTGKWNGSETYRCDPDYVDHALASNTACGANGYGYQHICYNHNTSPLTQVACNCSGCGTTIAGVNHATQAAENADRDAHPNCYRCSGSTYCSTQPAGWPWQ